MAGVQKAWFYDRHGTLDVLQFGEFPLPIPGPGQLLIQVRAAALNPADFKIREGAFRSSDFDLPAVPGFDVSGVVAGVGAGVTKFREGDHVYGDVQDLTAEKPRRLGTLAQYTLAEESLFALKPPNLSFEEAASLPVALVTALQGFDIATFQKDQTVLIVGGAGGVGSLAVQVAKQVYGASRVVATASTGKLEFVKSLGADDVVDYTKQSYHQIPEKFDFVFDTVDLFSLLSSQIFVAQLTGGGKIESLLLWICECRGVVRVSRGCKGGRENTGHSKVAAPSKGGVFHADSRGEQSGEGEGVPGEREDQGGVGSQEPVCVLRGHRGFQAPGKWESQRKGGHLAH